jgi:hypothetical protein
VIQIKMLPNALGGLEDVMMDQQYQKKICE